MISGFFPDAYYDSVYEIAYGELLEKGITNLIFDIDNTLAPFDTPDPTPKCTELLLGLRKLGFSVALLSNNKAARVETFNLPLGLHCVWKAKKPGATGLQRALELLGDANPKATALVGDQIFTDIWCARRNGLLAVLVKPQSPRDEFWVRIKRYAEVPVLWAYRRAKP